MADIDNDALIKLLSKRLDKKAEPDRTWRGNITPEMVRRAGGGKHRPVKDRVRAQFAGQPIYDGAEVTPVRGTCDARVLRPSLLGDKQECP